MSSYILEIWFGDWAPLVVFENWEEAMRMIPYYRDRYSWPLRLSLPEA